VPALWRGRRVEWHDTTMVKVLIVDDHPSFRAFARDLLESEGFVVVGESEDGDSGLRSALSLRPDVVLMDVQLPDLSGFEVTRRLLTRIDAKVVLVSTRDESDYGDDIESSGAVGFVPKAELSGARIRHLMGDLVNNQPAEPNAGQDGLRLEERSL
jgi:DNA-binding NarL/FixJ family response regulator